MKGNEIKEADRKRWEKAGMIPAACRLCGEIMLFQKGTYKPEQLAGREERQMTEREKVIKGLEAHANPKTCETCAGEDCPYYNSGGSYTEVTCSSFLAADALALLKEQEARVMTVEEARETLHTSEFLYCEDKNDDTRAGGLLRGVLNGGGYWDLINGEYMTPDCLDEGEDLEAEYGKTFRFWTAKPTPEQMRETKWEGEGIK